MAQARPRIRPTTGWGRRAAPGARSPVHALRALASWAGTIGGALRLRLREGLRRLRRERRIRRSGLFDAAYYLAQCGDDDVARRNSVRHYLHLGAAWGLDPHPSFVTSYYVERHRAVVGSGRNPLLHYLRHGARLGLRPSPSPGAPDGRAASRDPRVPALAPRDRVLVVDGRRPTPDQDSGSVRMLAILRLLAEMGHEVTFVAHERAPGDGAEGELRRYASTTLEGLVATEAHLREEGGSYRFALLSRPFTAHLYLPVVRALAPRARVIYDTVDLHWVRWTRAAALTGDPACLEEAARARWLERTNAARCDLSLAISEPERATLLAEVPSARIEVVPNIHAVEAARKPLAGRRDLLFLGGYAHRPNVDAVSWFVAEILPRILRSLPDVVLHVIGSQPPEEVLGLASANVLVLGYVPDPAPWFEGCRVFVAPLRYGAGMKGKIGQAMGFGLPVVTTTVGAEGLRLVEGEHALVADAPERFAAEVVRLYGDPVLWETLAEASWRHVARHFSEDPARRTLASIFPVGGREGPAPRSPAGGPRPCDGDAS